MTSAENEVIFIIQMRENETDRTKRNKTLMKKPKTTVKCFFQSILRKMIFIFSL